MSCEKCGRQASGRLCSDCEREETLENDGGRLVEPDKDARDGVRTGDCYALKDDGTQCTYSAEEICGVHEGSTGLRRVDDVPNAPVADLRDRLVDVGMHGAHAYYLASHYSTATDLWDAATALDVVEIGEKKYDSDSFASRAAEIAKVDDVDAGAHPLAIEGCIALTDSDKFDGECTNGSYSTGLLCGTHKKANDPDTKLDDADFPVVDGHGADHYVVDIRDDFAIVVDTDKWEVEKIAREDVEERLADDADADRVCFYRDDDEIEQADGAVDDVVDEIKADARGAVENPAGDDQDESDDTLEHEDDDMSESETVGIPDRPALLDDVEEKDRIRVTLENGDVFAGKVYDIGLSEGDVIDVFVDGSDARTYALHAGAGSGEWSDVSVGVEIDSDPGDEIEYDEIGVVDTIEPDDPDTPEDWVDPFVFDRRTNELEEIGLSGREAEVVACKESGLTHPQISEHLEIEKGTVDEYSRRARRKVLEARELVDAAGDVY